MHFGIDVPLEISLTNNESLSKGDSNQYGTNILLYNTFSGSRYF